MIRHMIAEPIPVNAQRCSFDVSHCSTNTVTNRAVMEKSIPFELKSSTVPIIAPSAVPITQYE